jgi:hypothetical protein
MQEYPVKRGYTKGLEESVANGIRQIFETEPQRMNDHYQISYGALRLLDVSVGADGKSILVRTESNRDADDAQILDTNRRYRRFLDVVTGYTTKERVKKSKSIE